jgi:hypothetical protein
MDKQRAAYTKNEDPQREEMWNHGLGRKRGRESSREKETEKNKKTVEENYQFAIANSSVSCSLTVLSVRYFLIFPIFLFHTS